MTWRDASGKSAFRLVTGTAFSTSRPSPTEVLKGWGLALPPVPVLCTCTNVCRFDGIKTDLETKKASVKAELHSKKEKPLRSHEVWPLGQSRGMARQRVSRFYEGRGEFRMGILPRVHFVFKEVGKIFRWRTLGDWEDSEDADGTASGVRESVGLWDFQGRRNPRNFSGRNNPRTASRLSPVSLSSAYAHEPPAFGGMGPHSPTRWRTNTRVNHRCLPSVSNRRPLLLGTVQDLQRISRRSSSYSRSRVPFRGLSCWGRALEPLRQPLSLARLSIVRAGCWVTWFLRLCLVQDEVLAEVKKMLKGPFGKWDQTSKSSRYVSPEGMWPHAAVPHRPAEGAAGISAREERAGRWAER